MTEMNMNGYEYLFNSKEGQEALKGLQRYGVNDLTPYEDWQLEFYLDNPLPWPRCCELFGQYAKYIAGHDEMPFDAWLATIEYDPALSDSEKTSTIPNTIRTLLSSTSLWGNALTGEKTLTGTRKLSNAEKVQLSSIRK